MSVIFRYLCITTILGLAACTGEVGPPGEDGANGYQPLFWASCKVQKDLVGSGGTKGSDGIHETDLRFGMVRYSNGDVQVTCEAILSAESSADGNYYPSALKGSLTGGCYTNVEYPPLNDTVRGTWRFAVDAEFGVRATYTDVATHPLDGYSVTFGPADCNVMTMGNDGTWSDSSLSAMF